jgi:hypothetical protein
MPHVCVVRGEWHAPKLSRVRVRSFSQSLSSVALTRPFAERAIASPHMLETGESHVVLCGCCCHSAIGGRAMPLCIVLPVCACACVCCCLLLPAGRFGPGGVGWVLACEWLLHGPTCTLPFRPFVLLFGREWGMGWEGRLLFAPTGAPHPPHPPWFPLCSSSSGFRLHGRTIGPACPGLDGCRPIHTQRQRQCGAL